MTVRLLVGLAADPGCVRVMVVDDDVCCFCRGFASFAIKWSCEESRFSGQRPADEIDIPDKSKRKSHAQLARFGAGYAHQL